jgi:very-short-patch-repair endonuclease
MPRIRPLPSSLLDGPFTIDTARSAGVGRGRLRGDDLERTYWGLRTTAPLVDVEARCRLLALRMPPGSFFSHVTAALVHGIPVPIALEHDLTIHVSVAPPARAPHARHLRGHRLAIQPHDVVTLRGLDVTTAIRTWCDLGAVLTLFDLVAAGDFIIHHRNPLATIADLEHALSTFASRRGLRILRVALSLLSDRAESPPESKLRVILVQAGFPTARINHTVTDRFGEFVARTDFILDEYKLVLEYQGDYHRSTKGQWRADMTRRSRLEAEGWRVMELNADDLKDPIELVTRIRKLARLRG